ncbi:MAG: DUF5926 family protein [Dermatophilaceae bacterium]
MGKASRQRGRRHTDAGPAPAPYVRRPFEGLPAETEWVAMRELLPAATAAVAVPGVPGCPTVTMATMLPLAWPALHRGDGVILVATQGSAGGDVSRDLAAALVAAAEAEPGTAVTTPPATTAATPRLQDLLDPAVPFQVTLHQGFDYWVGEAELDEQATASMEQANAAVLPTARVEGAPSVYWTRHGERTYVRWVLGPDEDQATDGLARLLAADHGRLTPDSRLLGAFRAGGLLVPVWEVDPQASADALADPVGLLAPRLDEAIASRRPLDADQRRARNGLLSRQVTLR